MARVKRRGVVFVLTPEGKKEVDNITGQGRLILKTLRRMGQATATDLRCRMGRSFKTKNNPASVIGVYLNRFKRNGLLSGKLPARA